jgi:hypothetical protein
MKFSKTLSVLFASLICLVAIACKNPQREALGNQLFLQIETLSQDSKPSPKILSLKDVTDFDWDEVYVFNPYTTHEEIESQLGFKWSDGDRIDLGSRDDINLLVFVKDNRVVQYLEVPRGRGDFILSSDDVAGLSPQQAKFEVRPQGEQANWIDLVLVDSLPPTQP